MSLRVQSKRLVESLVLLVMAAIVIPAVGASGEGDDGPCPTPEQIVASVELKCGDSVVVGVMTPSPFTACIADGQSDCVTTPGFAALAVGTVEAQSIRQGVTIAGVEGRFPPEIEVSSVETCNAEGQSECLVHSLLIAVDSAGLSQKILAGKTAAGLPGVSVLGTYTPCDQNGQQDCLTSDAFLAVEATRLAACVEADP